MPPLGKIPFPLREVNLLRGERLAKYLDTFYSHYFNVLKHSSSYRKGDQVN
jgi:hypothetical protein